MVDDFEFVIASPYDKEKLICELYYKGDIIAEISQENNELLIELYSPKQSDYWVIPFVEFQKAIERAKNHLIKTNKEN